MRHLIIFMIILTQVVLLCYIFYSNRTLERYQDNPEVKLFRLETSSMDPTRYISHPSNYTDLFIKDVRFMSAKKYDDADMLIFDNLNDIERVLPRLVLPQSVKYIFAFSGIDLLASKSTFANMMSGSKYIPVSFDISNKSDMVLLEKAFRFNNLFIIKKNIQQQQGIKLINSYQYFTSTIKLDPTYVVCQEVLMNPLIIASRKVNIRIYMLIAIKNSKLKMYIYNDGFMYYASEDWDDKSFSNLVHITSGYTDRSIYVNNPLTFKDLKFHLGKTNAEILQQNIEAGFSQVKNRYEKTLLGLNASSTQTCFSLFGCDIAPDNLYDIKFMEINKGPDLTYKDERDREVKIGLMLETMKMMCFGGSSKHFTQII